MYAGVPPITCGWFAKHAFSSCVGHVSCEGSRVLCTVQVHTCTMYMIKINEPQLPWLRTAIYHTGLDVKMEVTQPMCYRHMQFLYIHCTCINVQYAYFLCTYNVHCIYKYMRTCTCTCIFVETCFDNKFLLRVNIIHFTKSIDTQCNLNKVLQRDFKCIYTKLLCIYTVYVLYMHLHMYMFIFL